MKYPFYFVMPAPEDVWGGEDMKTGRIAVVNPYNQGENVQECDATDDKSE